MALISAAVDALAAGENGQGPAGGSRIFDLPGVDGEAERWTGGMGDMLAQLGEAAPHN